MFVAQSFISMNHLSSKRYISFANTFQPLFNGLTPRLKGLKTIPSLFLRILLNLFSLPVPTLGKRFFKPLRCEAKYWCKVLADLLPHLMSALRWKQEHAIPIK
jgi:hypothetical protein